MSSALLTTLGLRNATSPTAQPPSLTATYLITNYIFAHLLLSQRTPKQIMGLDNNVMPRQDLSPSNAAALIASGKLTQKQLDQLKRLEAAQQNSIENFSLFAVAMVLAEVAGVRRREVNLSGLVYTVASLGG
ncbi:hypothetical protein LTR56_011117 [Elasticomyces elasticus]|nr:hypothetical protein LTR56_011117 [Elasticomyces elasticus]KAK5761175.1 hypothetical protein LTS12_008656 [Elasticomyces elasticus]